MSMFRSYAGIDISNLQLTLQLGSDLRKRVSNVCRKITARSTYHFSSYPVTTVSPSSRQGIWRE